MSDEEVEESRRRGDATRAMIKERIEAEVEARRTQLEEERRIRSIQEREDERQLRRRRTR